MNLPRSLLLTALAALALPVLASAHVLFSFDDHALPLQRGLRLHLISFHTPATVEGGANNVAVEPGKPDSVDGRGIIYYGTVLPVGDEYWMWYMGMGGRDSDRHFRVCLATSRDGLTWTKPDLGAVDYFGDRHNNLVDLDGGRFSIAGVLVFHDEDAEPSRRFKMVFTGTKYPGLHFGVAYSPDGVHWQESPGNPRGPIKFEPGGAIRWHGAYYINGQGGLQWAPDGWIRTMETHISYDFEHWTEATAMGFRRDPLPPVPVGHTGGIDGEQVHLGAGLWDRGNVVVGLYGQWHGVPTNDRRWLPMDLGLIVSHDALHFSEPIPDFRMVQAQETTASYEPGGKATYLERAPAVVQGQGFANVGDKTLFWYSVWVVPSSGVHVASWERDRLGYLQPFVASDQHPHLISDAVPLEHGSGQVSVNVGGLGTYTHVRVTVLDEQFRPLAGYPPVEVTQSGLAVPVRWGQTDRVQAAGPIRLRIDFVGVRPEDAKLYAAYVN